MSISQLKFSHQEVSRLPRRLASKPLFSIRILFLYRFYNEHFSRNICETNPSFSLALNAHDREITHEMKLNRHEPFAPQNMDTNCQSDASFTFPTARTIDTYSENASTKKTRDQESKLPVEGVTFMDPYREVRCDPHHLGITAQWTGIDRLHIVQVAQRAHWPTAHTAGFERARVGDSKLLQTYWPTPTTGVNTPGL